MDKRPGRPKLWTRAIALLAMSLLGPTIAAEEPRSWQIQPALDLRTATYFEYSGSSSMYYPAIGAELSIELSSPQRPYTAGLFADYELGTHAEARRTQLVGNWFSYRYGRWKLSTVLAHYSSNEVSGLWMQASKLQFDLRPGHRLAVEAISALQSSEKPAFQLVYKTWLTQQASVQISVGLGSNRMRDLGASAKYVWNLY